MNEYELYHHGVKGMKWGIRRYQKKDGSYTKIGLQHYKKAEERYDRVNSEYKATKKGHKEGSATKEDVRKARVQRKIEKHRMSQAYDQVRRDYKADRGKEAYQMGKNITGAETKRTFVSGALVIGGRVAGVAAGKKFANSTLYGKYGTYNVGQLSNIAIQAGAATAAAAYNMKIEHDKSNIRAYYAHGRSYRDPDMPKSSRKKKKG